MMSFTATIDNGGAKTVIDGVNVKWTTDDQININGKTFTAQVEGDGTTAVFTSESGETVEGTPYKALYPADLYKGENSYELPEEQTYKGANKLSGINPMYAESSTTELQFHHLCGLLKLDVKGEGKVKEIVVTSADGKLSGTFTISEGGYAVVEDGSNTVTLKCGDGVTLNADNATTFYIALPQGKYDDLNVELKGGMDWSTTLSVVIHAGKIRTKELSGINVLKPDKLSGKFTINGNGDKVYFSKGNLQYVKSTGKWRFAEDQWEVVEQLNQNVGEDYDNQDIVTLFGYGTSGQPHRAKYCQPYSTGGVDGDYCAYDEGYKSLYDNDGSADWGYSYCEQEGIEPKTTWRTLTGGNLGYSPDGKSGEWFYLFSNRGGEGAVRYAKATVNGVSGIILVPDDWSNTGDYELNGANTDNTSFNVNTITAEKWNNTFEPVGCVFLPAASYRNGSSVWSSSLGNYWSSFHWGEVAYSLWFNEDNVYSNNPNTAASGKSVRLVCDAE